MLKKAILVISIFILSTSFAQAINVRVKNFSTMEVKNYSPTDDFEIPAVSNINNCFINKETVDNPMTPQNDSTWIIRCNTRDEKTKQYTPAPLIRISCGYLNRIVNFHINEASRVKGQDMIGSKYDVIVSCDKI